jgi:galactokinase/mevalonate kinase-like predicted kinase
MRTLQEIHREIDELSELRVEQRRRLSEVHDLTVRAEIKELDERLEALWDEHRRLRATLRWGERDRIIARARAEERLERHAA